MISLLKTFGKGLLYVIGAPFFIAALILFGVIGLGAFIFQIIKSIIYFFTGQKFFPELPEDKKLRLMKEAANQAHAPVEQNNGESIISPIYEEDPNPIPSPVYIQRTEEEPVRTIEDVAFEKDTSLKDLIEEEEEEILPQPKQEEKVEEEHTVLETNKEPEVQEEEYEELETYIPRSSTYSDADDDEDNDTDSGVDINYDL